MGCPNNQNQLPKSDTEEGGVRGPFIKLISIVSKIIEWTRIHFSQHSLLTPNLSQHSHSPVLPSPHLLLSSSNLLFLYSVTALLTTPKEPHCYSDQPGMLNMTNETYLELAVVLSSPTPTPLSLHFAYSSHGFLAILIHQLLSYFRELPHDLLSLGISFLPPLHLLSLLSWCQPSSSWVEYQVPGKPSLPGTH